MADCTCLSRMFGYVDRHFALSHELNDRSEDTPSAVNHLATRHSQWLEDLLPYIWLRKVLVKDPVELKDALGPPTRFPLELEGRLLPQANPADGTVLTEIVGCFKI